MRLAIDDGFKKYGILLYLTGQRTTILTGIVLYVFGSGPIRGFATTLIIGILTSLFTALLFQD